MNSRVTEDIKEIIHDIGPAVFDMEGKKVLISGACGFLGSWFIAVIDYMNQHVFDEPCYVRAIDSFIAADKNNALTQIDSPHIDFVKDDISSMDLSGQEFDYIIHAAGIASPIYYRKYPIETIEGMVMGLNNLLKLATRTRVKSFLNFSSSEMYGNPHPDKVPTEETYNGNVSCIGPRSCYDESKRMGETMCMCYHSVHGVPVKWVRPFNVYGPGMRVTDDRVVPKFTFQMLKNEPITVHVPGIQTRTFCYITDAMTGFFKALLSDRSGEVYNIGRDKEEITMQQLAEKMLQLFPGTKSVINTVEMPQEYPQDQAQRRCPSIVKAADHLGYQPKINLEEGLQRTYTWCQEVLNANG